MQLVYLSVTLSPLNRCNNFNNIGHEDTLIFEDGLRLLFDTNSDIHAGGVNIPRTKY